MLSIIVAFPRIEDANKIKNLLVRNGYEVALTCNSAAQVIDMLSRLDGGIVLCGYRLTDMLYLDLYNCLPAGFSMMLMASPAKLETCSCTGIEYVTIPLKMNDFLCSLESMCSIYRKKHKNRKPKARTEAQEKIIAEAKQLLMIQREMTEDEAHKYIQKISMDSGNSMSETAEMILLLK